jgi:hypothetical protein
VCAEEQHVPDLTTRGSVMIFDDSDAPGHQ